MIELNNTEREILVHIANGLSGKQIAPIMKYKETSIESYRYRMVRRCGCKCSAKLVAWGFKNKYLI